LFSFSALEALACIFANSARSFSTRLCVNLLTFSTYVIQVVSYDGFKSTITPWAWGLGIELEIRGTVTISHISLQLLEESLFGAVVLFVVSLNCQRCRAGRVWGLPRGTLLDLRLDKIFQRFVVNVIFLQKQKSSDAAKWKRTS
jgi:hypothetical protein